MDLSVRWAVLTLLRVQGSVEGMPSGFCYEHSSEGALLAVVVGRLTELTRATLSQYRAVLWLVDAQGRSSWPAGVMEPIWVPLPGGESGAISAALEHFVRGDPLRLPSVLVSDGALDDMNCADGLGEVTRTLRGVRDARVTRQLDGFSWQKHVLENLPDYVRMRLPATWAGAFQGVPAVVCGAGPSLDVTGVLLKTVSQRVVVFSADSALAALGQHGVAADFGVSVDVSKHPHRCLARVPEAPRWMCLSGMSSPAWSSAPIGAGRFFCSGRQVTLDWLAGLGIETTAVAAAENCGATALVLARFFGCAPIYLFGMDQALDEHNELRRHHQTVEQSLYAESGFKTGATHPRVPGNYASTVPTHVEADWRALNETLLTLPAGVVFNVTDRGARLSNTRLVSPEAWSLPRAAECKIQKVGALTLQMVSEEKVQHVLRRVRTIAQSHLTQVDDLALILDREGITAVRLGFCRIFADRDFSELLGAFSFKVMPHLIPPVGGDFAFWEGLVTECRELTRLAAGLAV